MNERNWTYLRFFLPSLEALDDSVGALADDPDFGLIRLKAPWFYLRYVDMLGPQLRVRISAGPEERIAFVDWGHSWYRGVVTDLAERDAIEPSGMVPGRVGIDLASYRPETTKYGGMEAVRRVEDLWARQCETTIDLWAGQGGNRARRTGFYTAVARQITVRHYEADSRQAALRNHAWYWLRSSNITSERADRQTAALSAGISGWSAPPAGSPIAVAADDISDTIDTALTLPEARSESQYVFNLLHILANRLGLSPFEEALTMIALANSDIASPNHQPRPDQTMELSR